MPYYVILLCLQMKILIFKLFDTKTIDNLVSYVIQLSLEIIVSLVIHLL